ncbi:hypothetical protein FIT77_05115 [Candidatus Methylopumilus universalis]|uniref:hypothetical protein n=1 Tax=Candidatus Methylopumilus universalis TaxID=2588536 RepID=UPI00111F3075|nr:hypothetical protein [Candidatus Methylopumilus universalis]QDC96665.1 hypothetical protein FIT77_05115 [Candidatus Methylopumilus universalis]
MKIIFYFLVLIGCDISTSYSMDFWDKRELENIIEDKLLQDRITREIEQDIEFGNRIPQYTKPPPSPIKYFGKTSDGVLYGIFLNSIKIHKSGKYFLEFSESKFPRYSGKITYFGRQRGYVINCENNEFRVTGSRYYDASDTIILINPSAPKFEDSIVERFPNSSFYKITPKTIFDSYKKFICN